MTEVAADGLLREVRDGLQRQQKEISPKFFYDRRGSELFEEITRLTEYYLTDAEVRILESSVREWLTSLAPASLVELGAGSARKTRLIIDGMIEAAGNGRGVTFVPVDLSAEFLESSARALRREYEDLAVRPVIADMSAPDFLDGDDGGAPLAGRMERPLLLALLGSTLGNFRPREAERLLRRARALMASGDAFLLGVDLRPGAEKPVERLEAAYNDPAGVTARFNRNALRVLNRRVGTDFDPSAFRHRAFYDHDRDRIEMHLEARTPQTVRLPDGTSVRFRAGESLRTEVSHKYDRSSVAELLERAGLALVRWMPGDDGLYAMAVGETADAGLDGMHGVDRVGEGADRD